MTVNYTTNLALGQPVTGTESGTWGDDVNNAVTSYLDIAIAGGLAITITTADVTLTNTQGTSSATNIGSTTAQYAILNISGAKTAARNLIVPSSSRHYIINNVAATGGFLLTVKGAATTGITLVDGEKAVVAWNGTDYVKIVSNAISNSIGYGTGVATALAVNVGTAGAVVVNGGVLGTPSSGTVTNLTGTASININGTVGATTPAAGAFNLATVNATARSAAALTLTAPAGLYSSPVIYTDNTTAASGTAAFGAINSIGSGTIAASNTSVTYTEAASLYIAGGPTAGTNVTIGKKYALYALGSSAFGSSSTSNQNTIVGTAVYLPASLSTAHSTRISFGYTAGTYVPVSLEYATGSTVGSGNGSLAFMLRDGTADSAPVYRLGLNYTGQVAIGQSAQANYTALNATSGAVLSIAGNVTITDKDTAASATVSDGVVNYIGQHSIAATNTAVTYTNAYSFYVSNAPGASTNVTITNSWSAYFGGKMKADQIYPRTARYTGDASLNAAGLVFDLNLTTSPGEVGVIGWGYTNNNTNANLWASIAVRGQSALGNGYGDMAFLTRSVTTDTLPTARLIVYGTGQVLATSTAGLGYGSGAGGTVTQITSISTNVTLNTACGKITCVSNTFTSGTTYNFVVNNSSVASTDCIVLNLDTGSTTTNSTSYQVWASGGASGSFGVYIRTNSTVTNTIVLNFAVIKGSSA